MRISGFSVVEVLVALAVVTLAVGTAFAVLDPARGLLLAQQESADQQQRLRVAVEAIAASLRSAGAGPIVGGGRGPLVRSLAPVWPLRLGEVRPDVPAGVRFRSDVVSIIAVPVTAAQVTLREAVPPGAESFVVVAPPSCPPPTSTTVCGFGPGARALVFDGSGAWDAVTITSAAGDVLTFTSGAGLTSAYPAGATLVEGTIRSWSIRADAFGTNQLFQYDGFASDVPVVDHIVSMAFEYFGEPRAPLRLEAQPLDALPGPWTTYGPRPPLIDVDDARDEWPPGESCLFRVDGAVHTPRLPTLGTGDLVRLDAPVLTDGPWCPSAGHPHAFDADLLRIRRVRVRLRTQVPSDARRGGVGAFFARAGHSLSAGQWVPDEEVVFDVAPPNLDTLR